MEGKRSIMPREPVVTGGQSPDDRQRDTAEDRLVRGYVVDFIYVHHWPVFNVADICVVAGVALLLLRGGDGRNLVPEARPKEA